MTDWRAEPRAGDRVRFSERGRDRVRAMPEAWGLHRALYQAETGEVVDVLAPAEEGEPLRLSVEFPSGGAFNWEADCFEPEHADAEPPAGRV